MGSQTDITLVGESMRIIGEHTGGLGDIWRHEGLKHAAENGLAFLPRTAAGRRVLEFVAGPPIEDERLVTSIGGIALDGPVGVGAGWDKTARTLEAWQLLGASHVIPGAVNLFGQSGNNMPRLRTFDHVVGDHGRSKSLNAMGFNSPGLGPFLANLLRQLDSGRLTIPIIPQATMNKEFYEEENRPMIPRVLARTVKALAPHVPAVSLGLTSPNTMGMRDAQAYDFTRAILHEVRSVLPEGVKLEYKGDGDGGEERGDMYCRLADEGLVDIFSLINTTALPEIKGRYGAADLMGGLAGAAPEYQALADKTVKYVYEGVGDKVDIIGIGGVNSGRRALRLMKLGASAVDVVSAIPARGPRVINKIKSEIVEELDRFHPGKNLTDLIGLETSRGVRAA